MANDVAKRTPEEILLYMLDCVRANPDYNKPTTSMLLALSVRDVETDTEVLHRALTYNGGMTTMSPETIDSERTKALLDVVITPTEEQREVLNRYVSPNEQGNM